MLDRRWHGALWATLLVTAAVLFGRDDATIAYILVVLVHWAVGIAFCVLLGRRVVRGVLRGTPGARGAAAVVGLTALSGLAIAVLGGTSPYRDVVNAHMVAGVGAAVLLPWAIGTRGMWKLPAYAAVAAVVVAGAGRALPENATREMAGSGAAYGSYEIANPSLPPSDMAGENTRGEDSPFFPSSVETADGEFIPSEFFMNSARCGEAGCHPDIYEQWLGSAHRFSSFNNQWYRSSITYMQEMQGDIEPSKWCAGCHDPAVLLSGRWTKPMAEQMDMPEAHAGLGCAACHSISHVKSTMGNNAMVYEYPTMHRFAAVENPLTKALHDYVVKLDPAPHAKTFMKPFHTEQSSEFCSTCHKVHLDAPVNDFRWIRGFNEYDAWHSSGVSGRGALAFYYPAEPRKCNDCHMPLLPSDDAGNIDGQVHSHRFPAANTALPHAWGMPDQQRATTDFLQSNIVTLDVFGLTIGDAVDRANPTVQGRGQTTFSLSGDETGLVSGASGGAGMDVDKITAPLGAIGGVIRRGDSARLSVVVRTRGVGHRFPGGTFDAFDVWVELVVRDETGRTILHSGGIEPNGSVDRGAHFYRAALLDAAGNIIDKRNAWAARTLLYARGIPPGAADTVHFRLDVPDDCGSELQVEATLFYRKFDRFNTQFSYAGVPADDASHGRDHDSRAWEFTGDTSDVAGEIKRIPTLPIIRIAQDTATIRVFDADTDPAPPATVETKARRERWNDYGIGLLLQGDLKGAREVFEKVTRMDPEYPDGWVNVARAALQEGDLATAEARLTEALRLLDATPAANPHRGKAHYFMAQVHRRRGDFDEAIAQLRVTLAQYPLDGRVLNSIGHALFLKREFADAIETFNTTLGVDPENLMAHYNLMLCYQGMSDREAARRHQALYLRFKADESSQAITGAARRKYPHLNLERQAIREHYHMEAPGMSPEAWAARDGETAFAAHGKGDAR
ncbi:tetratricopeptide repeat protein [Candidatus Poribacteria bacterium]|jgi:Tfp pilus assembly protein PilF|nr:tetratricopeptide repeat protein [Candidatus Poribacteria bacterium]MBT5714838.1 tetratricopeptide repeat protein [Candidatus Poribacteria bacterium]MBT7101102.1 tetratricopeptide repeat protein [Candidatus Poribacteria bacterium]MBT7807551.1 tetratricopeptide repeat protein [Candidatus Poribacteria bacterium]